MHGPSKANGKHAPWIWRGRTADHPLSVQRKRKREQLKRQQIIVAHMIPHVAEILDRGGHPTKFRFEGFCRAALRSGFILHECHSWRAADFLAERICQSALARIGARRPSWHEAQPEFDRDRNHSRMFCANENCGKPIERQSLQALMYCSEECRRHAKAKRNYLEHREERLAYVSVHREALRETGEIRSCEWCSNQFAAIDWDKQKPQRFCCHTCANRYHAGSNRAWRPRQIRGRNGQFVRLE